LSDQLKIGLTPEEVKITHEILWEALMDVEIPEEDRIVIARVSTTLRAALIAEAKLKA